MAYQHPKWKSFTLPSWEQVHIMRAPPSSIMTRKKERVDMADVEYMIRNDDSRINEGVAYLARGNNYMQDVNYNNHGAGGTTTMMTMEAKAPYRNSEAFRPPIYKQEDRLPLSRMPHSNFAVSTNPGIRTGFVDPTLHSHVDMDPINAAINKQKRNYISVRPTFMYNGIKHMDAFNYSHAIDDRRRNTSASTWASLQRDIPQNREITSGIQDRVNYSASAPLSSFDTNERGTDQINFEEHIKNNPLLKNISSNFSIVVYNPATNDSSEVKGSIKDKMNIAVASSLSRPIDLTRDDGTPIKLKQYRYKVVQSNVSGGTDTLVVFPMNVPDLHLDRNMPLYAAGSNSSGFLQDARFNIDGDMVMADPIRTSASAPASHSYGQDPRYTTESDITLRRQGNYGSFENDRNMPTESARMLPHLREKPRLDMEDGRDRFSSY